MGREVRARIEQLREKMAERGTVSYTHLTLPTKLEV